MCAAQRAANRRQAAGRRQSAGVGRQIPPALTRRQVAAIAGCTVHEVRAAELSGLAKLLKWARGHRVHKLHPVYTDTAPHHD